MNDASAYRDPSGVLTEIPRYGPENARPVTPVAMHIPVINLVLFALTLLTTTMAGAYSNGADLSLFHPIASLAALSTGLSFSIPLMAILLSHEMGHYLTSRRNGVDASLPYFLPAPFPSYMIIGTFGAFIRMREVPRSRRVMFDIGAAGPWAGMLVALPCVIIGLRLSSVSPLSAQTGFSLELGNSLLFWGISRVVLGVDPNSVNITMHPMAFAGWIGLFVTTLNLLPIGQLDGGHVVYTLFPRWHRTISTLFVGSCVLLVVVPLALGYSFWAGWLIWAVLGVALGLGHPVTQDRDTPLDSRRSIAAWATVVLFIVTFVPVPISISTPEVPTKPQSQSYDVRYQAPANSAPPHLLKAIATIDR
ncbi:MAG TPA: site-2 protease family protein [Candidatus Binataceae bacterium]|nr:site-2 protease family protein [Candidatus Binataceae bacterium]